MIFYINTKGFNDVVDITEKVSDLAAQSGVEDGICLVSCSGSTAGITTIEYEEGAIKDLKRALEILAPMNGVYEHQKKWGDGNGYAHVRSALMKPCISFPMEKGRIKLGTWQQIVLIDFDNRPRERELSVKVVSS
jgi:secondary thiamine-phosphate synthase enzyme